MAGRVAGAAAAARGGGGGGAGAGVSWTRRIAQGMLTSGVIHAVSDTVAQVVEGARAPGAIDLGRVGKFATVGFLLHGPFFTTFFTAIDRVLGTQRTFRMAMLKSTIGQIVAFPVYLAAFFAFRGALDGAPRAQIEQSIRTKMWPTVVAGTLVWMPANVVNFVLVPAPLRVFYVNLVGVGWNSYLSLVATAKQQPAARPAAAELNATAG